jgi:hypothetical protein
VHALNLLPGNNGLVIKFPRGRVKYPIGGINIPDTLMGFFQDTLNSHFAYGSFVVEGPSIVVPVKEQISIGLGMRIKGNIGSLGVPAGLIPFTHVAQPFFAAYPIEPFRLSGAVYAEIPLTIRIKKIVGFNVLSVGSSLKVLLPMMSAYVDSKKVLSITQRPSNNFNLSNVEGDLAFSVWSRNPVNGVIRKSLNGFGMGLDLGGRLTEGEGKWYLGASLTDIGYIGFRKNSTSYSITSSGVSLHAGSEHIRSLSKGNVIQMGNLLSTEIMGSSAAGVSGSTFNLLLPASFNVQGGMAIGNAFFLSAMANIPLLRANKKLTAPETLMIMPSWESGFWAIKVPFTLSHRKSFTTGFALRTGPLTLGSDRISSWFVPSDFTGTDFYVALQLPLFFDNRPNNQGKGGRNNQLFRCYSF